MQEVVGSNPAGPTRRKTCKSWRFTLTRGSSAVRLRSKGTVESFHSSPEERTVGTRRNPTPSYLPHNQSGRARAVWTDQAGTRRDRLLPGPYDSQESRAAFGRLVLELETSSLQTGAEGETVADVLLAFRLHADKHYRDPDGNPTSEIHQVKIVIKAIRELYGEKPVGDFGPLALKAARQKWVNDGRSRTECNRRIGIVKRIFRWAVSEQLVPVAIYQAIATVAGLQKGRTNARELEPIGLVDDAVVDATLPFLNRHVRGLVELQRLTGCRPGEACSIRRSEIDTGGAVWLYKPTHHKTSHRGKSRTVAIGPRGQKLLREFFTPDIEDYLFSPRRALAEVRGTPAKAKLKMRVKKRAPKERYNRTSYTRAIARAVVAAQVEHWHPNQLRHTHATKVRKAFGLEHAGAALGHAKMSATEIYAERDAGLALEVAAKLG